MNPTLLKFGFPAAAIREYEQWAVLVRPRQVTLGSVIVAEKSEATALGQLSQKSLLELGIVSRELEATLQASFQFDKINYIALMMVDPNVHFHVLPRYSTPRSFGGMEFRDTGWPKHPDMQFAHDLSPETLESLRLHLASEWRSA
jgi:diadenosine tetraphosphate (Ap4A) HIT family hydrolase